MDTTAYKNRFTTGFATPSALLRHIIEEGATQSRAEQYADSQLRRSSSSWYAKEAAASGTDAAERKLTEWVAKRVPFADSVGAAASGLLALAKLDDNRPEPDEDDGDRRQKPEPPHVRLVSLTERMNLPGAYRYDGGALILGTNPHVPGCSCMQPKGSGVFGRGGEIGLRFIGIAVNAYLTEATLLLFLPHPDYRTAGVEETRLGFAVIGITTEGHTHGQAVDLRFCADPVEYELGLVDGSNVISGSAMSSGINAALRFPDSDEYLARHIPNLVTYLEDAAAKLAGQHSH